MDFSTYCNICLRKTKLKNICSEDSRKVINILLSIIENTKILFSDNIYICNSCYEKLDDYGEFKKLCITNLISFRQAVFDMKIELENHDDTDIKMELGNIVRGKLNDINESINFDINKEIKEEPVDYEYDEFTHNVDARNVENTELFYDSELCDTGTYFRDNNSNSHTDFCDIEVSIKKESEISEEGNSYEALPSGKHEAHKKCSDISKRSIYQRNILNQSLVKPCENALEKKQVQSSELSYKCKVCGKSFNLLSVLETHLIVHSNFNIGSNTVKKRHKCSACQNLFATPSHLKIHMRSHHSERSFTNNTSEIISSKKQEENQKNTDTPTGNTLQCNLFSDSLNQRPDAKSLQNRVEFSDLPYKCIICDKSFILQSVLETHLIVHSSNPPQNLTEKRHKCNFCETKFHSSSKLQKHMKSHGFLGPFKCNECIMSFEYESRLIRHQNIHGRIQPYKCKNYSGSKSGLKKLEDKSEETSYICNQNNKILKQP